MHQSRAARSPRIVAVEGSNGQHLSLKQGRPYVAGRDSGQAAAFVKVSQPGTLTILVSGQHHSTGTYETDTTLVGDVNGDGTVSLADLQPFAEAYETAPGNPKYNLAADFNHDGIVNQVDAKALMENMPPLTPKVPLQLVMNLLPADQAHYAAPKNSGGSTFKRDITIEGHTMPGSIVLEDNSNGFYKVGRRRSRSRCQGNFSITETNTEGVNTYNFLVIPTRSDVSSSARIRSSGFRLQQPRAPSSSDSPPPRAGLQQRADHSPLGFYSTAATPSHRPEPG